MLANTCICGYIFVREDWHYWRGADDSSDKLEATWMLQLIFLCLLCVVSAVLVPLPLLGVPTATLVPAVVPAHIAILLCFFAAALDHSFERCAPSFVATHLLRRR